METQRILGVDVSLHRGAAHGAIFRSGIDLTGTAGAHPDLSNGLLDHLRRRLGKVIVIYSTLPNYFE